LTKIFTVHQRSVAKYICKYIYIDEGVFSVPGHKNFFWVQIRICGSVIFSYGSGSGFSRPINYGPGLDIFVATEIHLNSYVFK
jgi:hypothetical protein